MILSGACSHPGSHIAVRFLEDKVLKSIVAFVFVFILILSAESQAQISPERYSVSPFIGRYEFDHQQKLDVSPVMGLRLGYALTSHFGLEGVLEYVPTESSFLGDNDSTIHGVLYHMDALYYFRPDKRLVPFLAVGFGGLSLDSNPRGADTNFMANYGFGAQYHLSDRIGLRGDFRFIFVDDHQTQHNMELAVGLVYAWGSQAKKQAEPVEAVSVLPQDSDGDGIGDSLDQCPNSVAGTIVDQSGCAMPLDRDGDGVRDDLDRCPDSPAGDKVDAKGCSVKVESAVDDVDGDGVSDGQDFCPGTPSGVKVDGEGCPMDSDSDGVPDHVDECQDTPRGLLTDGKGCTLDTDRDGVSDSRDRCADTPVGIHVNEKGCPLDDDRDGIYDEIDDCPGTPEGVTVDAMGCPDAPEKDRDADGVSDALDQCPDSLEGATVDHRGCMVVTDQTTVNLNIRFDTGKARVKPEYDAEIRKISDFMKAFPNTTTEVEGHTDNTGPEHVNRTLSQRRADSVRQYLISRFGIDPSRLTAKGHGASRPIADNDTPEGREKNRRVVVTLKAE